MKINNNSVNVVAVEKFPYRAMDIAAIVNDIRLVSSKFDLYCISKVSRDFVHDIATKARKGEG